ncbi:MAG: hypothetical protein KF767_06890 [Bdellovibrionaceae bacterium]|nr:hypothetical protein [Pseudobdellovibrionaceae bacterium]
MIQEIPWAASTAALMTTITLLMVFAALFGLIIMSVLDSWHDDHLYEVDRKKNRRPLRLLPLPG